MTDRTIQCPACKGWAPVPPARWDGAPATCLQCGSVGRVDGRGIERWYDRDGRELRREEAR